MVLNFRSCSAKRRFAAQHEGRPGAGGGEDTCDLTALPLLRCFQLPGASGEEDTGSENFRSCSAKRRFAAQHEGLPGTGGFRGSGGGRGFCCRAGEYGVI
jgi:hypothetical protein